MLWLQQYKQCLYWHGIGGAVKLVSPHICGGRASQEAYDACIEEGGSEETCRARAQEAFRACLRLGAVRRRLQAHARQETLEKIHIVKRDLIFLRRILWPQREVINELLRGDDGLVHEETQVYLRDCYDHTIQIMDLLETYRDMAGSMLDIYLSSVSNRMNEIMRVLTIIATIFIPLTFIVGVYGMNFDRTASTWNMPELGWPYGYLLVWVLMIGVAVAMMALFRRRGWF